QLQVVLLAMGDARGGPGNLAGNEGFAAAWALMVEQDPVAGVNAIRFTVIYDDPESIQLCYPIRAARVKWSLLRLWHLLHQTVELGCRGLVKASLVLQAHFLDCIEEAKRADSVHLGSVFRHLERDLYMALCA